MHIECDDENEGHAINIPMPHNKQQSINMYIIGKNKNSKCFSDESDDGKSNISLSDNVYDFISKIFYVNNHPINIQIHESKNVIYGFSGKNSFGKSKYDILKMKQKKNSKKINTLSKDCFNFFFVVNHDFNKALLDLLKKKFSGCFSSYAVFNEKFMDIWHMHIDHKIRILEKMQNNTCSVDKNFFVALLNRVKEEYNCFLGCKEVLDVPISNASKKKNSVMEKSIEDLQFLIFGPENY